MERISLLYNQIGDRIGGWSENFWCEAGGLNAAIDVATRMAVVAQPVHGRQTYLAAIRVTVLGNNRITRTIRQPGNTNLTVGTAAVSDYQTNAAGLELRSGNNYTVRTWIRGIWDSAVVNGGQWVPTPALEPHITKYLEFLTTLSNNLRLVVLDKNAPAIPIQSVDQMGVVTAANHGFSNLDRIRIKGTAGIPGLNKTWTVGGVTQNTFTINPWIILPTPPALTKLGTAMKLTPIPVPITYARVERASKRDVGRPFGLLSGRRSKRAR